MYVLILLAVIASSAPVKALSIEGMQGIGDTRYHQVESNSIGQNYHVFVGLPKSYEKSRDRKYPTIYILDGGELYPLLSAYYRYLNLADEVPEAILVAISYGTDDWEKGNNRGHDYTAASTDRGHWGGAGDFQSFLSDELIPLVENKYRSRSDSRIVFGQSLGGQFVLYTAQTRPNLFWGHIASNPALHRNLPFFLEQHGQAESGARRSRLFLSSGSMDEPRFRIPALEWIRHWTAVESTPWDLKTMTLGGHSHFSAPPVAFRQGMIWLFAQD